MEWVVVTRAGGVYDMLDDGGEQLGYCENAEANCYSCDRRKGYLATSEKGIEEFLD